MKPFNFTSPEKLIFGPGKRSSLPGICAGFGRRMVLITGRSALQAHWDGSPLLKALEDRGLEVFSTCVTGEPSPEVVDGITREIPGRDIDLVVAVGGGSVLDAGKAVSAMAGRNESVSHYLEGVGTCTHDGNKVPFIAVPTTSGTGSEATKNAVISLPGPSGYKKSLRHDNFIPDVALVDPELTLTCPFEVTAACGMDALTQLLEAYTSASASPMTDALCRSGLKGFGVALETVLNRAPSDLAARMHLAYGSYISGLALANAGLGTVHGFASVIGGMAVNRHGQVCGTLLAETTAANIKGLEGQDADHPVLQKYADAAVLLGLAQTGDVTGKACRALCQGLFSWTLDFGMPTLNACGMRKEDIPMIAEKTGQKNNPVCLSTPDLIRILENRWK